MTIDWSKMPSGNGKRRIFSAAIAGTRRYGGPSSFTFKQVAWIDRQLLKGQPPLRPFSIGTQATQEEAKRLTGVEGMNVPQQPVVIGTPVPVIWGFNVWVSPPAVRWGYRNSAALITSVHAVTLGEGRLGSIAAVFWGGVNINSLSGRWAWRLGSLPDGYDFSTSIEQKYYYKTVVTKQEISFGGDYIDNTGGSAYGTFNQVYESQGDNCTSFRASVQKVEFKTTYVDGARYYIGNVDGKPTYEIRYSAFRKTYSHAGSFSISGESSGSPAKRSLTVSSTSRSKTMARLDEYDKEPQSVDRHVLTLTEVQRLEHPLPEVPKDGGGSGGSLSGLQILTAEMQTSIPDNRYRHQVHVKVAEGLIAYRLREGSVGSSSNFADLTRYLLRRSSLVPNALIDDQQLLVAAHFTAANGLNYNGILSEPTNLREFLERHAPLFLCSVVVNGGKFGLLPMLPYTGGFGIRTAFSTVRQLTGDDIVQGTYSRTYVPLSERKLPVILATWRNQAVRGSETRVREVRYTFTPEESATEAHDWSSFCTSQAQADTIARYILARRRHITHRIGFSTTLQRAAGLVPGHVVYVSLERNSSQDSSVVQAAHYQIDSVTEGQDGLAQIEASHFPTYNAGTESLVARDVLTAGYFAYS